MSVSSPDPLSAANLAAAGLPAISSADIPSNVRNGNAKAKDAYLEGLQFESMLVNELAQQLENTVSSSGSSSSSDSSSSGSSGDSDSDTATGLLGSGSEASAYASLIPQALTNGIMSTGGLGVADEIAKSVDPSLAVSSSSSSTSSKASAS